LQASAQALFHVGGLAFFHACSMARLPAGVHARRKDFKLFRLPACLPGLVSRKHAVVLTSWPNGSPSRKHAGKPAAWNGCRRTIHLAGFQTVPLAGWH
jgi:hypothetical protein